MSRVRPVNHLHYDKHTQTKHCRGNPHFLMNKRKDINYRGKENYLSVAAIFLYKLHADLSNNDVELNLPDFNKSDVGCKQVECRILTSRMSDVGCRMSDFNKSNVGFLQVGCQMSDVGFLKSDVGWHL